MDNNDGGADIESEGGGGEKMMSRNGSIMLLEDGGSGDSMMIREPLLKSRVNTTSQIAIVGANVCPIESLDYE
nr:chloride channel protein CLC-c [Tanacetum cinerariifolium]